MKKFTSAFGRLFLSAVLIFLVFYTMMPAINLHDQDFIVFLIICILIVLAVNFMESILIFLKTVQQNRGVEIVRDPVTGRMVLRRKYADSSDSPFAGFKAMGRPCKYGTIAIAVLIFFFLIASAAGIQLFNASRYRDLITVTEGDFASDVAELGMSQIPVVDKDTASRLGSKKLGEMTDLVSQFEIQENYTQINYKGTPYRVTPLRYADPIKWLYNQKKGLPAYIAVNMVDQDTDLVWLSSGMKYSTSEYFFRNIHRYIRFCYPTRMFETVSFEIDDDGNPYWVAPTIAYRIGWWNGKDIDGAVLVNAETGESKWYAKADVPQWIDQLYDSNLIMEQLDDNGRFQNGYLNSIFGQRGVRRTTYGYNYLAIDDDVWLYTGMSSVTSDESNIGFVLVNLRTKETKFYTVPGAFSNETASRVLEGTKKVVNDSNGTGYAAHRDDILLAGKTGTAEIKASKDDTSGTELGWFAIFTAEDTVERPILIISMVEDVKGRGGSGYVVKKDRLVLEEWFSSN